MIAMAPAARAEAGGCSEIRAEVSRISCSLPPRTCDARPRRCVVLPSRERAPPPSAGWARDTEELRAVNERARNCMQTPGHACRLRADGRQARTITSTSASRPHRVDEARARACRSRARTGHRPCAARAPAPGRAHSTASTITRPVAARAGSLASRGTPRWNASPARAAASALVAPTEGRGVDQRDNSRAEAAAGAGSRR